MKEPILFRRDDALNHEQALYWKDLLYRTIKIGTELEFAMPKGARKSEFMPQLIAALEPSRDLNNLGQYGVLDVISEHCGIEVQIIGRQPYYTALLQQYRDIFALLPTGIRTRPTCGLHYHLLTVGLGEPVPEIILANAWNLTRRYAPELRFLTSGGDCLSGLCRRRNHNSHLEMVKLSPGSMSMREVWQHLHDSKIVPEHQNFLNLQHIQFDERGAVSGFHLEFRFCDADLSPISITAKTFLFLAIVLKAVEMSQYGVIHVGRIGPWRRKIELLDMLSNNDGALATSDTSRVTPQVIEELRVGCQELLELVKPVFDRFEHNPSFEVLSLLAETPISLLRASGRDWPEIDALLAERAETEIGDLDKTDQRLMRCIELAELTGCPEFEVWKWTVARELFLTPQELDKRLTQLDRLRGTRWDSNLGTVVLVR
ncbi:MAG: hypothetical protein JW934_19315 [Anaerolineae bacterium]|nr:hypothetical protein [Anaerolineae bacterium]